MVQINTENKIVKVKKNPNGDITDVMLSNGNILPLNQAISMARDGQISDVNVSKSKSGKEFLRTDPNNNRQDNLDNLPIF